MNAEIEGLLPWGLEEVDGTLLLRISAKWAGRRLDCTVTGITTGCHGGCCKTPSFWPAKSGDGVCPHLGPQGCTMALAERPVTCNLFPLILRGRTLVAWGRTYQPHSVCSACANRGPLLIEALQGGLTDLFGAEQVEHAIECVRRGEDPELMMPAEVYGALLREAEWEDALKVPEPRSGYAEEDRERARLAVLRAMAD